MTLVWLPSLEMTTITLLIRNTPNKLRPPPPPPSQVHTDAAQSMGRLSVDVKGLGVDLLTLVGHKFGAPKGVGALFIRRGVRLVNLLSGGSQEGGRRGG